MSRKKLTTLNTTEAVIDALKGPDDKHGTQAVADLFVGVSYTAAFNWRGQHTFPSRTYFVLQAALLERGYTAPASLRGMPMRAASAA